MALLHETHPHYCDLRPGSSFGWPDSPKSYAGEGSIWQCDECGKYWLTERELWNVWRRISPRRARRLLRHLAAAEPTGDEQ